MTHGHPRGSLPHLAIVHPAGACHLSESERAERKKQIENRGFSVSELVPRMTSSDGYTAGAVVERAALLCQALTTRKYDIVMAARGGVGCTEILPFLQKMLPPVLPQKILVGYSDISFLGVYLALNFENLTFVHGNMAFSKNMFNPSDTQDTDALFSLLNGQAKAVAFEAPYTTGAKPFCSPLRGACLPLNLSLGESLACLKDIEFPKQHVLFLEDCNEHLYRILRKIDNLANAQCLANTQAIVLGGFNGCIAADNTPLARELLIKLVAEKTGKTVIDLPIFGHDDRQFPLVMGSSVTIEILSARLARVALAPDRPHIAEQEKWQKTGLTAASQPFFRSQRRVHLTGIGGTGMAQVAGLLQAAGHAVSGSDKPIYPPMDSVIKSLGIIPDAGFTAKNIQDRHPDAIVLANVISPLGADLKKNEELDEILRERIPVFSFPSILRHCFLSHSCNIVVTGTHGKTTTSSLVAHLFNELQENPSFLIGGQPANFSAGFALRSRELFVLEGDEYDTAFFDKGPKFLHYEPTVCLLNNIEFDHADIYPDVEAIEQEFSRLASLTKQRGGIVVANLDDPKVRRIVETSKVRTIGFARDKKNSVAGAAQGIPTWTIESITTKPTGIEVVCRPPNKDAPAFAFTTQIFGEHNAQNAVACIAIVQAYSALRKKEFLQTGTEVQADPLLCPFAPETLVTLAQAFAGFRGVKRRFELLLHKNGVSVFDDFAHHPTAIRTTLQAFRQFLQAMGNRGRLIVCFDPRNATMRRKVLQDELCQSLACADEVFIGKVAQDLRINEHDVLDSAQVAKRCPVPARAFSDNEDLLSFLVQYAQPGDTVVFMSSGAFDGLPQRFAKLL